MIFAPTPILTSTKDTLEIRKALVDVVGAVNKQFNSTSDFISIVSNKTVYDITALIQSPVKNIIYTIKNDSGSGTTISYNGSSVTPAMAVGIVYQFIWDGTYWSFITNGILESGSNVNGYYVKYSDGTLLCYGGSAAIISNNGTSPIFYGSSNITFPHKFKNTPFIQSQTAGNSIGIAWGGLNSSITVNGFTTFRCAQNSGDTGYIHWSAFGRWK